MRIIPKKSLGQNFLIDKNIQKKIISSLELSSNDTVIEIGPGRGELTTLIAPLVKKLCSVEIDRRLKTALEKNFQNTSNVEIINQDFLKFDLDGYLKKNLIKQKIKVFGNIPYYITSPIIERLINFRSNVKAIFITVQKEFAERIIASPGSKAYGSFSCFVQYYCIPKILFIIKKTSFNPVPKVDSCFLELLIRDNYPVAVKSEEALFNIIRKCFNQRRKTLRNSLKETLPEKRLDEFFEITGLSKDIRPDDISLENFAILSNL